VLHESIYFEQLLASNGSSSRPPLTFVSLEPQELSLLALRLKTHFDTHKYTNISQARPAVLALESLASWFPELVEVQALALWTQAMLLAYEGQPSDVLPLIDAACAHFAHLGQSLNIAAAQLTRVVALSSLGRYGEALSVALAARSTFEAVGDAERVADIDCNLGHISYFTANYDQALAYYARAEQHFATVGDMAGLVAARDGQAEVLVEQGQYAKAAALHESIIELALQHNDVGQRALTLNNLGYLYAQQGIYHRAIDCFQQSLEAYAALDLEVELHSVGLRLAEVYLLLNMLDEALYRCKELVAYFSARDIAFEQAYALMLLGIAQGRSGRYEVANATLSASRERFSQIGSVVQVADLQLAQAELQLVEGRTNSATALIEGAVSLIEPRQLQSRTAYAHWLLGEAKRTAGQSEAALTALEEARALAVEQMNAHLQQRCVVSLGLLALKMGELHQAEAYFSQAVTLIETARAPLPAEDLRVAFFSDKLIAYHQLVRLAIERRDAAAAFEWSTRARARALLDLVGAPLHLPKEPQPIADSTLTKRYEQLREGLQFRYNRLKQEAGTRSLDEQAQLEHEIKAHEHELATIHRRLAPTPGAAQPSSLCELQRLLGHDTQLISYWVGDGSVSALVLSADGVELVPQIAQQHEIAGALQQFRVQVAKVQYGEAYLRRFGAELIGATEAALQQLYALLFAPLRALIKAERLIVVPDGLLHYVPFAALHDGDTYLLQHYHVSSLPAASLLPHVQARPTASIVRPLLVGVPDAAAPAVAREVEVLAQRFPRGTVLLREAATTDALHKLIRQSDALHLASHAVFRPTSPLFSSLRLADGWLSVREVYDLDCRGCELVTLSACETGLSYVAAGDELLGLARGFLAAGAGALLLSQWMASDEATAELMPRFYNHLCSGESYAGALRAAQLEVRERFPHPAYWAAFVAFAA
jgi:CHAT domain-containing protein